MAVNEKIRIFVKECLDSKKNLSTPTLRNKIFKDFADIHKNDSEDSLNWDKHRTIFLNELKKEVVKRGIDPVTYGLSRPTNFQLQSGGAKLRVKPSPKSPPTRLQSPDQRLQTKNQLQQGIDPNKPQLDASGQPVPQFQITVDLVRSTWKTIFSLIQLKYPDWKPLSDQEAKSMGEAWLQLFQEYLQSNWLKWGIPIMITAGITLPRILEKKSDKTKSSTEKQKEDSKKSKSEQAQDSTEFNKWLKSQQGRTGKK